MSRPRSRASTHWKGCARITHIQFHSYGTEGDHKFSSGAAAIAEAINANPNISVDVGQIRFGRPVTEAGDTMRQYAGSRYGDPKKWVGMDIECDAGCGVVPFRYRNRNFVNALQWAIGLELFLLVDDPWRIFLTTDHPNGAPFTSYPHLIRLLMDKSFRRDMLATITPDAAAASHLGAIDREYSLYEIAVMTRAAPARALGLEGFGSLAPGARATSPCTATNPIASACSARPNTSSRTARSSCATGAWWPISTAPPTPCTRPTIARSSATSTPGSAPPRPAQGESRGGRRRDPGRRPRCVGRAHPRRTHMKINGVVIEDTFAEAFPMKATRLVVTALNETGSSTRRGP